MSESNGNGIREKIADADGREMVELRNGTKVELRDIKVREVREFVRLSGLAGAETDAARRNGLAVDAQIYLLSCTVYDPATGTKVYAGDRKESIEDDLGRVNFELLAKASLRVTGLAADMEAMESAKNESRANAGSSTASPETSGE